VGLDVRLVAIIDRSPRRFDRPDQLEHDAAGASADEPCLSPSNRNGHADGRMPKVRRVVAFSGPVELGAREYVLCDVGCEAAR
jgi:hypothetical protein